MTRIKETATPHSLSSALSSLLLTDRPGDSLVALNAETHWLWKDFQSDVIALAAFLASQPAQKWLLTSDCSYQFAVYLFALLHSGKTVLLPPNSQSGSLAEWSAKSDAVIGGGFFDLAKEGAPKDYSLEPIDSENACVEVVTSGSTGEPKIIRKPFRCFEKELQCQYALWQNKLSDSLLYSTVSHQHIYGLLFRVLLPLRAGIPFWSTLHQYPEHLIQDILAQQSQAVLISSPAHLNRLPPGLDLPSVREHLQLVFSSGGPLDGSAALQVEEALGHAPVEILGSTETGGIAWRTQSAGNTIWQALPDVAIRQSEQNRLLEIHSPYCDIDGWFQMGDQVSLIDENRFELHGRADRIVKIEGKRLSLSQMEQRLNASEWVERARILQLPTPRKPLAAVIELSGEGREQLSQHGKRYMNEHFKSHLLSHFERVLLPRKWRFPEALPCDSQGKTSLQSLVELFDSETEREPLFESIQSSDAEIELHINLAGHPEIFEGHFEKMAILAGVTQISWVMTYSERWYAANRFAGMEKIKFHRAITAADKLHLHIRNLDNGKVEFHYSVISSSSSSNDTSNNSKNSKNSKNTNNTNNTNNKASNTKNSIENRLAASSGRIVFGSPA